MNDSSLFTDQPAPASDLFTDEPAPHSGFQFLSNAGGVNNPGKANDAMAAYWKQAGDNPQAGAEIPAEQRLANNVQTAGAGAMLPTGIASVANLGKSLLGLGEDAPTIAKAAKTAKDAANAATTSAPPNVDPLADVKAYVLGKYGQASAQPGFAGTIGKYLKDASLKMAGKDLGMGPSLIKSLGPGLEGTDKAKALAQYAMDQGYLKPSLGTLGREELLKGNMAKAGQQLGALRAMADAKGAGPDLGNISGEVENALKAKYGKGELEASPKEMTTVLGKLSKTPGTYSGLSDLATNLNKSATPVSKLGQHPGPYTDAANIISRLNNEGIRPVLGADKAALYDQSLKDFGATKKLEQTIANAERREIGARSNQRGVIGRAFQELLDKGGYRLMANALNRTGNALIDRPTVAKDLPSFFGELAHHTGDVADEAVQGFNQGGEVQKTQLTPSDVAEWVSKDSAPKAPSKINDISDDIKAWVNGYRKSDNGTLVGLRNVMRDKDKPSDPLEYDKDSPADRKKSSDSE